MKVTQSCLTLCDNPGLLHCRRILYQLSHKGNPRILEWVAYPFSSGSSRTRNWTGASCIAGRFFTNWAIKRTSLVAQLLKNLPVIQETWVWSLGWEDPLEKEMATTPILLPGGFHGQRSLAGYSPWDCSVYMNHFWLSHKDITLIYQICRLNILFWRQFGFN